MRKLLRPKDVLLLGLGGIIDIAEELHDPFGLMEKGTKELYGWTPKRYQHHNVSRMILRELKTGEIEKATKNGEVYLRLTSAGKERIVRDFPIFSLAKRKWDGKWRVVIFDINEINRLTRDLLRLKLKELGFGMLQESVWITPHDIARDIREFLEARKLKEQAFVLEISAVLAGEREFLVEKIWHLRDINSEYLEVMLMINNDRVVLSTSRIKEIRKKYLQILLKDPCLPKELLPEDWAGEKTRKAMRRLPKE